MNTFKVLGVVSGIIGATIGGYYSFTAVLHLLNSSSSLNAQIGIYSAIVAAILGMSLAFIGIASNKSNNE